MKNVYKSLFVKCIRNAYKIQFFLHIFNVVVTRSLVQNKTRISQKHTFVYTLYLENNFLNLKNMGNEPLKPLSDTLQGVIKKN